jgi:tubby and related proteins
MSFRSLIQDMRDEFGSISRHTLRSRSHRSAGNASRAAAAEPSEAMDQSCWSQLPPELLREVLVRIEASESWWPARKDVVSCAGVCRTWRGIMKEAVRVPEVSGKLTFPISLKQVCGLDHPRRSCLMITAAATFVFVRFVPLSSHLSA